jgi:hypothetical protein
MGEDGSHEVVSTAWQIRAIFPVSGLVEIMQMQCKKAASAQVSVAQLSKFN